VPTSFPELSPLLENEAISTSSTAVADHHQHQPEASFHNTAFKEMRYSDSQLRDESAKSFSEFESEPRMEHEIPNTYEEARELSSPAAFPQTWDTSYSLQISDPEFMAQTPHESAAPTTLNFQGMYNSEISNVRDIASDGRPENSHLSHTLDYLPYDPPNAFEAAELVDYAFASRVATFTSAQWP
jgi:hypothetical protein